MAKGSKGRQRLTSRHYRSAPYPLRFDQDIMGDLRPKKCTKILDSKDWEDVTCSVCMEYPHNAVLLLCSSHDKGCRPYMCGTSFRHSNCLDQYKKAYTKVVSTNLHGSADNPIVIQDSSLAVENTEVTELACPLCRGQVKGWTVVEPAREYLNAKKRSCIHDDCSFLGNYKELRKHVKAEHPSARPREVDPALEQKWRRLERERERNDVISTITSTMPGAMFFGDYVIEGNNYYGFVSDDEGGGADAGAAERNGGFEMGFDSNLVNVFLLLHAFGPSGGDELNRRLPQPAVLRQTTNGGAAGGRHTSPDGGAESSDQDDDNDGHNDDDDGGGDMSLAGRLHRHGRVLLGRSGRRRRRRELNGGPR